MAKLISFVKTLRNNWKKTVFACMVVTYGGHYAKGKYDSNLLMNKYCNDALNYGNISYSERSKNRNVTVFLNPAANKRKAKKNFDKYCAPLLHLAGLSVTVVQTKSQGDARTLAEHLNESVDAVIVAGGDGTLSEVVTGLLRRETSENPLCKRIPIGVLPLGLTNTTAKELFFNNSKNEVMMMAEATMAVITEIKGPVDVMQIEQLEKEQDQRPIYSVSGLRWGAVHDAFMKRDKYWYWGPLRTYMAYVFMGLKENGKGVTWNCDASLSYSLPCSGCSQCYLLQNPIRPKALSRWWQSFVPKQHSSFGANAQNTDYSKIKNENCNKMHEVDVSSVDLFLETSKKQDQVTNDVAHLVVSIGPPCITYWDFIARGWQYVKGNTLECIQTWQVKDLKLLPKIGQDVEHWFYIDNDDYEVKPVHIKLLPKRIQMFCQQRVPNE